MRASLLTITLTGDDGDYRLAVRDDGVGFDPQGQFDGHFGLTSMRERASRLEVRSRRRVRRARGRPSP